MALLAMFGLALAVTGCGDDNSTGGEGAGDGASSEDAGPPCFGLEPVESLPDWADSLTFGERHEYESGFTDLTGLSGCSVETGVVAVSEDGRMTQAWVENCDDFESAEVPADIRPGADEAWSCWEDAGGGAISVSQRQG